MSDLTSLKNRWDASAKMRDMSLASDLVRAYESELSALQGELASLEKRNQNITDAMNRWGWSHCTTEKELIEQIDFILGELAEREWVSVEDRLPEPDVDVLTAPFGPLTIRYLKPSGEWFFDALPVTHWQPLPAFPTDERK